MSCVLCIQSRRADELSHKALEEVICVHIQVGRGFGTEILIMHFVSVGWADSLQYVGSVLFVFMPQLTYCLPGLL